ncbi:hypothetical protein WKW50_17140 [Ochrobactrum sp. GPK 3]
MSDDPHRHGGPFRVVHIHQEGDIKRDQRCGGGAYRKNEIVALDDHDFNRLPREAEKVAMLSNDDDRGLAAASSNYCFKTPCVVRLEVVALYSEAIK